MPQHICSLQFAARFCCFNKTHWRQQAAVNDMPVWGPPLCNTFRISHNGQLPMSLAFISSMCHWTVKSKDTWHHMFPCAVMTASSNAFMAVSLWGLSDQRHVQASIRCCLEEPSLLTRSFFYMFNTSLVLYSFTLCCSITKFMWAAVWKLWQNPWGALKRKSRVYIGNIWAGRDEEREWGQRAKRRENREADRERQRWRHRERETGETKGMWSSRSLCLAAAWLKRRVPGERGGSRPAQSVLLLPWSPACRPQKRTAKPSGRAPFIVLGPPSAPKNLQSKHRLSRL